MAVNVAVYGTLRFPPENIEQVLPHLKTLVDTTYQQDGCLAYDVALDPFDKGLIRFSELWPSRDSLNQHLVAPHIEPWRQQAKKFGLMARKFESYDVISDAIAV